MGKRLSLLGRSLLRHKYIWTLIIFVLIVGFIDPNSMLQRHRLHQHNEALRAEIRQFDQKYQQDSRTFHELQVSQEAVENVARVSLFMKSYAEDVYVIEEN